MPTRAAKLFHLAGRLAGPGAVLSVGGSLQRRAGRHTSVVGSAESSGGPSGIDRRPAMAMGPVGNIRRAALARRQHPGGEIEACLFEATRRNGPLAQPRAQAARPSEHVSRLRHLGFPGRRSPLRQPTRSCRTSIRRTLGGPACNSRCCLQPLWLELALSARHTRRQIRSRLQPVRQVSVRGLAQRSGGYRAGHRG